MNREVDVRRRRTHRWAQAFLEETRLDVEHCIREGADLPPRLRVVRERAGHATPEFRTLIVPIPPGQPGISPEVLSESIARYARSAESTALLLALDAVGRAASGEPRSLLIVEAHDNAGNRMFWMQGYRAPGGQVEWSEPERGGWFDPDDEQMILDAAYVAVGVSASPNV